MDRAALWRLRSARLEPLPALRGNDETQRCVNAGRAQFPTPQSSSPIWSTAFSDLYAIISEGLHAPNDCLYVFSKIDSYFCRLPIG